MGNIVDYAQNNMDTIKTKAFNPVDSLILSKLSYIRLGGIVPDLSRNAPAVRIGDILKAEMFSSMLKYTTDIEGNRRFLYALAASPRYRNIKMKYYVEKTDPAVDKQFSAVTYLLEDKTAYVAFRGTDSTFVGWKEDFNMAFTDPIPSQKESVLYLETVAKRLWGNTKLRVGGHSKGGNLAIYSAVKCSPSVQKRISAVFNHDGPGFKNNLFESSQFRQIKDHIHTTLPEASLIGMLMQHHDDYKVVSSSRHGIMQHDSFSWETDKDDFVYLESIKSSALARSKVLNQWLDSLENEKRKMIVDVLFQIIDKTNASTFQDLSESWSKNASLILSAIKGIDPESRKFITKTIGELAKISVKSIFKTN